MITESGEEKLGGNLEVSTDAPGDERYVIRIVDSEQRNIESEFVESGGDVETRFLLDRFEVGTCVIAFTECCFNSNDSRTAVEVEPFVVKEYTLDQSASDVTEGDTITVIIELTKINDRASDPQVVNVTLFGNGTARSMEPTSTGEGSYRAQFDTNGLSTGSYRYDELVGQRDLASVRVKDTEISTPKPEDPADTDNVGDGSTVRTTKHDTDTDTDTNADSRRQTSGNCTSIVITGIYSIKCAESTQTETQRRASEPTAIEIPQSSPSKTEPKSMTTNSEIPLLPSGGIITLFGILIGVLHRIQCSNQMVGRPTDYMLHETPY